MRFVQRNAVLKVSFHILFIVYLHHLNEPEEEIKKKEKKIGIKAIENEPIKNGEKIA